MIQDVSRRSFIAATAAGAAFAVKEKPAVLGGSKTRTAAWPSWPVIDKTEDDAMLAVLHSRQWYRGGGKSGQSGRQAAQQQDNSQVFLRRAQHEH